MAVISQPRSRTGSSLDDLIRQSQQIRFDTPQAGGISNPDLGIAAPPPPSTRDSGGVISRMPNPRPEVGAPTRQAPGGPISLSRGAGATFKRGGAETQTAAASFSPDQSGILGSLSALGPPNVNTVNQWWAANGPWLQQQGFSFIGHARDPVLVLPDGTHIDLIQNAGGANPQWQWLIKNGGSASSGGLGPSGLSGVGGGAINAQRNLAQRVPPVEAAAASSTLSPEQRAFQDQLRQTILQQMGVASEIPTLEDDILAPQAAAAELGRQRSFEGFQRETAERAGALGLGESGAPNVDLEGFQESLAEQGAATNAGLVANELQRRRSELVNLVGMAAQIGDADLTRDLQERLVVLDAELNRQLSLEDLALRQMLGLSSLALDRDLGFAGLDLNRELGLGGLDLGASQLGEGARQFDLDFILRQAGL